MYKVTFSFFKSSPRGGDGKWKTKFRLFDASSAEELEAKIKKELDNDGFGYEKNKSVDCIERI